MGSLTNELLNVIGDEKSIRTILEDSRDFLLEPLEEEDALAGSGSIYTPDMTRFERYQAYRASENQMVVIFLFFYFCFQLSLLLYRCPYFNLMKHHFF